MAGLLAATWPPLSSANLRLLAGATAWLLLSVLVAWGCSRWWRYQRARDERDRQEDDPSHWR